MRYLKIFEEFEEGSGVPKPGFSHSYDDIKEYMVYLTDVGFKYVTGSKGESFLTDGGNVTGNLWDAQWSKLKFTMEKKVDERIVHWSGSNPFSDSTYFIKWDDKLLEMYEGIANFCHRFTNCYYNLDLEQSKWVLRFQIYEEVSKELRDSEREKKELRDKRDAIPTRIEGISRGFINEFTRQHQLRVDNLGMPIHTNLGGYESGFYIIPLNISRFKFLTSFEEKVQRVLGTYNVFLSGCGEAKFRKITPDDIDRIKIPRFTKGDYENLKKKFVGLSALVLEFDWNKLFSKM
jgi:hypothetical protein